MILDLIKLLDGNYFFLHTEGTFIGSRIELISWLADAGFSDEEAGNILQILDSLPAVKLPANRRGYC